MTFIVDNSGKGLLKMWLPASTDPSKQHEVEDAAMQQLHNIAAMPFIHRHVAVMPDCHAGKGATVGSVIGSVGAIIPAAVGVDIGCGMAAVRTTLKASDLPDNLHGVRTAIEAAVPHGRTDNGGRNDRGAWGEPPAPVIDAMQAMKSGLKNVVDGETHRGEPRLEKWLNNAVFQLGTLGTGNHFVEICLDESQNVWFMLHSGSRGVGNAIGTHFIGLAQKDMERWFINLPDKDLAYIPEGSPNFRAYVQAVGWAQSYAKANRDIMMAAVIGAVKKSLGRDDFSCDCEAVNCHHNYISKERHFGKDVWLTRKGAVSAKEGELGIIPGSMGAKSFIVRGKGNRESFCSCSHGAGRKMSRTEAQKRFTIEDHIKATAGIECRKDAEVIDETPMAYKDIDAVMEAQRDLVDVVATLRQVVCVKG